jgi:hypothetical protein
LKLLSDICRRQEFGRTEMAASGVVNYHVEMTGLAKGVRERSVNLAVVPEIELDTMKVLELRQTIEVARCSPHFMTGGQQRLSGGEANSGAGPS